MPRAAIDIGSNSVRIETTDGFSDSVITKLADGVENTERLSDTGVIATLDVLSRYAQRVRGYERVDVFATEAVRRAKDGKDFIRKVKSRTGLDIRLLSGEEEARLALAGATKPSGAVTVCDLGGGSLEVVSSPDGVTPDYVQSRPLGVVVLKNRYKGDYAKAVAEAPELLESFGSLECIKDRQIVAVGGSACTLAAALMNLRVYDKNAVNGYYISTAALDDAMPMIFSKSLHVFRPVCKKRADTLPYGAIILHTLALLLGKDGFYVSDSGNLKAVLDGFLPPLP